MLLSLHIENVAVIKSLDIDFSKGFSALTGETGAGKSVILDCISLLLGAKADKELVRHGFSVATVSGCFGPLSVMVKQKLSENGIELDEDGMLLVQRIVSDDGRSQVKLNGRTVTLALLRNVTPQLISIHGQSDTASLTDAENHIILLDTYAASKELLDAYTNEYLRLEEIRRQIKDISEKEQERERLREILQYQINDIDAAALKLGEEEELVERKVKIRNSEKIQKHADFVYRALRGAEKVNVSALIDKCAASLKQLSAYMPECDESAQKLYEVLSTVDDVAERAYDILDGLDRDPGEALNFIEERLDKITKLKRKYGLTVEDILAFRDKAKNDLDVIENSEEILEKLNKEEKDVYNSALKIANELHELRVSSAKQLEASVKDTLEFLDMPKVVFYADIKTERDGELVALNKYGMDTVEFYITANRGAEAQPLSKIASGGELARIMLALKSTIADKDGVSTLIFDEIDAGVSGKTARKIGIKMLELSKSTQLICVTHSAQIASLSDVHFLISKRDVNSATETTVEVLDYEGRIKELSRVLGGINITASQREAAVDMLKERPVHNS